MKLSFENLQMGRFNETYTTNVHELYTRILNMSKKMTLLKKKKTTP